MIGTLVSKIAGPRILIGLILASALAIGSMGYLLLEAKEAAGSAEALNRQLTSSLQQQEEERQILRRAMARREQTVAAVLAERDAAVAETSKTRSQLNEALSDDQCANTDHPGAVSDSLQYNTRSDRADED